MNGHRFTPLARLALNATYVARLLLTAAWRVIAPALVLVATAGLATIIIVSGLPDLAVAPLIAVVGTTGVMWAITLLAD